MNLRGLVVFQILLAISVVTLAQQPAPPRGSIEGIVVESATNRPLPKASLELRSMDNPEQRYPSLSGDSGVFAIRNVPAGRYALIASHAGFMHAEYGQRGPNGRGLNITLAAGEKRTGTRLVMTQSAAISGHTFGPAGSPVAYVQVQALRISYPAGQRTLTLTSSTVTDDLGAYRLYGLPPGQYIVSAQTNPPSLGIMPVLTSATPPVAGALVFASAAGPMQYDADPANQNRRLNTIALSYYPNATDDRDARVIELRPGSDLAGIDATIGATSGKSVTVTGSVTGDVAPNENVSVVIADLSGNVQSRLGLRSSMFSTSLPQGSYLVTASLRRGAGLSAGFALLDTRSGNAVGLTLALTAKPTISGRVVVEGHPAGADPDVAKIRLEFRRSPTLPWLATSPSISPQVNGSFVTPPLIDGDIEVKITDTVDTPSNVGFQRTASFVDALRDPARSAIPESLRNSYVKALRATNAEVVNQRLRLPSQPAGPVELEVVLALDGGQLTGVARDASGQAQDRATVVLVPSQQDRADLYKNIVTDTDGRFRFEGIPPGDYRLFCWDDVQTDDWRNPAFLTAVQDRGKPVRVDAGSRLTADALMIPIRD